MTRMKFIPELRAEIFKHYEGRGFSHEVLTEALRRWDEGEAPRGIVFAGLFGVFEAIQSNIEKS